MNKQITRENYELYFLDYLEGELDIAFQLEFQEFLIDNPDLKAELKEMSDSNISLIPDDVKFEAKDKLKESVATFGELSFEEMAVARLEGDLSQEETEKFDNYLETHTLGKKEYLLFESTKLQPDLNITFADKSSLKRYAIFGINSKVALSLISAAASIILLFSVYFFASRYFVQEQRQYSIRSTESTIINNDKTEVSNDDLLQLASVNKQTETVDEFPVQVEKNSNSQHQLIKANPVENSKRNQLAILQEMTQREAFIPVVTTDFSNTIAGVEQITSSSEFIAETDNQNNYLSPKQFITLMFKKKVLKEEPENINTDKVSFWEIADAGLNGLNRVTGSSMKIEKKYDQSGELIAYGFNSSLLSFEKPLKRHQ